ncbi:MAG: N-acetylmuramoyl-L-alanine amidase, partial [Schaedlerella sp.]
ECGFLSNQNEANLLVTEEYQDKMPEAVVKGIQKYLSSLTL